MQQIYKRTPMLSCGLNKVAKQRKRLLLDTYAVFSIYLTQWNFYTNNHSNYLDQKDIKYKLKKEGQQKTHRQLAFRSLKDTKKKKEP